MSLLHRNVLSKILQAIDPLIEVGAAVVNPAAGVGAKLVLTDVENIVAGAAAAGASTAAAPVPAPAPAAAPAAASPAPSAAPVAAPAAAAAPLSAQDVIDALLATLNSLAARAQPK